MGLILLIIAILLSWILFPLGWFYSLITLRLKWSRLNDYALSIAISLDQMGNVVLSNVMNDLLIEKGGYRFGNPDDTISAVLGFNKKIGMLKKGGKLLSSLLNKLDANHVEKASEKIKL
jgi:8-oxo-dGTP diphosphatase